MLRMRNGQAVTVRFVEPRDAKALQNYLPHADDALPLQPLPRRGQRTAQSLLQDFIHVGEADRFVCVGSDHAGRRL